MAARSIEGLIETIRRASAYRHPFHQRRQRRADLCHTVRPFRHGRVAGETDVMRFIWAALLCVLASQSSLAQQRSVAGLDRPDPGIGEGFAAAFADQFKTAFGVNDAEARCLVYEVMADLRATGKYDSKPVDIARKVASRCALVLKGPR
jgi:hypothetical protein